MNYEPRVVQKIADMLETRNMSRLKGEEQYVDEHYEVPKQAIGEGGCGKVFKVRKRDNGTLWAMKVITLLYEQDYSDPSVDKTSEGDRDILKGFARNCQEAVLQSEFYKHPNVVRVHDKWIQSPPDENEETQKNSFAYYVIAVIEHLILGESTLTDEVKQAIKELEGKCHQYINTINIMISTTCMPL